MDKILLLIVLNIFVIIPTWATAAQNETVGPEQLMEALQSSNVEEKCEAALQLGQDADVEAIAFLAKLTEDENPEIRKCGIEALRLYRDQGFCQDFYTIWLADKDRDVRKAAGISVIENGCEQVIERSGKYAMDSKTCGYTQFFINSVKEAIADSGDDWKKEVAKMKIRETIVDDDTPEEIINMRLNLVFATMDWGETVSQLPSRQDHGSLQQNHKEYISAIEEYKLKEEFIKQFCPLTLFPDFSYWNKAIMGER